MKTTIKNKDDKNKKNLYKVISHLKHYSLFGIIRYIYLKLFGKEVVVQGKCRMCGSCCQRISLEAGGRWLRKESEFRRLLKNNSQFARFSIVGKDAQGFLLFTCSWYEKEGVCRDHENRLAICRDYPTTQLYFTGGRLSKGCGYRISAVTPFETILKRERKASNGSTSKNSDH